MLLRTPQQIIAEATIGLTYNTWRAGHKDVKDTGCEGYFKLLEACVQNNPASLTCPVCLPWYKSVQIAETRPATPVKTAAAPLPVQDGTPGVPAEPPVDESMLTPVKRQLEDAATPGRNRSSTFMKAEQSQNPTFQIVKSLEGSISEAIRRYNVEIVSIL